MSPPSVAFTVEAGKGQVGAGQLVNTNPALFTYTPSISSPWIVAPMFGPSLDVNVDAKNLKPGNYTGTITGTPVKTLQNIPIAPTPHRKCFGHRAPAAFADHSHAGRPCAYYSGWLLHRREFECRIGIGASSRFDWGVRKPV